MKKLLLCAFGVLLLQSCESEEPLESQELLTTNKKVEGNFQVNLQDLGLLTNYQFDFNKDSGYTLNFQTLEKCTAHIEDEKGVVIIYVTPDENGSNSFDFNLDRPEGFQFAFDQNLGNDNSRAKDRKPAGNTDGGG
tara:strand:- start:207 stop:614 length:408 start_codon:yes stop_codon:yes gene_type:complete